MELRGVHAQERGQGDGNVKKLDKWEVPGHSLGHPSSPAVEVVMVLQTDNKETKRDAGTEKWHLQYASENPQKNPHFHDLEEHKGLCIGDTLQARSFDNMTSVRTINTYYNPLEFTWQVKQRF